MMILMAALLLVAALCASGTTAQTSDSSTMDGKIICGYQGWFCCPGDGNDPAIGWQHWSRSVVAMGPGHYNTELWPDTREYDPADLFEVPNTTLTSGAKAYLFSSSKQSTMNVHFRWMQENGIDGVLLERFTNGMILDANNAGYKWRNTALGNVKASANRYGRVWAVEYDVTGDPDTATIYERITGDWKYLKKTYGLYRDKQYLHHNGRPVVTIFGLGFRGDGYPISPELAARIIDYFQKDGCWVIGGVPWGWRTLSGGSKTDPAWSSVFRSLNGIKPWTVGAYRYWSGILQFRKEVWIPDLAECERLGITYMPTAWPRFGWDNMHGYPCGQSKMSSRGGQHLWDQLYVMKGLGARTIYGAMFDECDESTAMMKTADDVPNTGCWWTNEGLPNDWFLRLLNSGGKMLRGETPLSRKIPISPSISADNAEIVGDTIPKAMVAGRRRCVSVTVKNTGETCWNRDAFELVAVSGLFAGHTASLPAKAVAPGQSAKFRFSLTPSPGDHRLELQMTHAHVGRFGAVLSEQIVVK
jgi:hypothetical protein